jgi:hypothetical protein
MVQHINTTFDDAVAALGATGLVLTKQILMEEAHRAIRNAVTAFRGKYDKFDLVLAPQAWVNHYGPPRDWPSAMRQQLLRPRRSARINKFRPLRSSIRRR